MLSALQNAGPIARKLAVLAGRKRPTFVYQGQLVLFELQCWLWSKELDDIGDNQARRLLGSYVLSRLGEVDHQSSKTRRSSDAIFIKKIVNKRSLKALLDYTLGDTDLYSLVENIRFDELLIRQKAARIALLSFGLMTQIRLRLQTSGFSATDANTYAMYNTISPTHYLRRTALEQMDQELSARAPLCAVIKARYPDLFELPPTIEDTWHRLTDISSNHLMFENVVRDWLSVVQQTGRTDDALLISEETKLEPSTNFLPKFTDDEIEAAGIVKRARRSAQEIKSRRKPLKARPSKT